MEDSGILTLRARVLLQNCEARGNTMVANILRDALTEASEAAKEKRQDTSRVTERLRLAITLGNKTLATNKWQPLPDAAEPQKTSSF